MKVFVAYGYNDQNKWIEEMAIPVIKALGFEVVHGKEIPGLDISDEIIDRIKSCDLLVGFLTKREDDPGGGKWVRDEIVAAKTAGLLYIPVVEKGVNFQSNILGDVSWEPYDETSRDMFLVNLIKAVADKSKILAAHPKEKKMLIRLEPGPFNTTVNKFLDDDIPFFCKYRFSNEYGETIAVSNWLDGTIRKISKGLGIEVDMKYIPVPENSEKASIEVKVKVGGDTWLSEPQPISRPIITMGKIEK
jgi:hypothetical protein